MHDRDFYKKTYVFYKSNLGSECKNWWVNILINDMNLTVNNVTIIYIDDLRLNRDYTVSCMTGFNESSK